MGKKRLTRLRIHSVDAVDRGAGDGVRIVLHKRADLNAPVRFSKDGQHWDLPGDLPILGDLIAHADALGLEVGVGAMKGLEDTEMTTIDVQKADVQKAAIARMNARADAIMAAGGLRSRESAIAKIAASGGLDGDLWREYRAALEAPSAPVEKTVVNVDKAVAKMRDRIDELVESGLSRPAALLKISSSRDERDSETWQRFKASGGSLDQYVTSGDTHAAPRRPSDVAFEALVAAIAAMHPTLTKAQAIAWAKATQQHRPPDTQRLVSYPL